MTRGQIYCTAQRIINTLDLRGFENKVDVFKRLESSSEKIQKEMGEFIPVHQTRYFGKQEGFEDRALVIDPLITLTSITNDGETVTDYTLKPYNREWENGPYSCIERDEDWATANGVAIEGDWGKYEELFALDLSVTQETTTETTLIVTDGSLLSQGMLLLIDQEQQLVVDGQGSRGSPAPTLSDSLLDGEVLETSMFIQVDDGSDFHVGEILRCELEDMAILKISGDELLVERGWNGTEASDHADNSEIYVYRTFKVARGVNGTTAASHTAAAVSQYLVPPLVSWLCEQMTVLMIKKAESDFTGVTGNSDTGEGKYFSEFPPNQIREVLKHFVIMD